jgi:hypothetical protein
VRERERKKERKKERERERESNGSCILRVLSLLSCFLPRFLPHILVLASSFGA